MKKNKLNRTESYRLVKYINTILEEKKTTSFSIEIVQFNDNGLGPVTKVFVEIGRHDNDEFIEGVYADITDYESW